MRLPVNNSPTVKWLPITIIMLAVAGCADGRSLSNSLVRDSSGVAVVVNFRPEWTEEQKWSGSVEPGLRIGVSDGAQEYQFFRLNSSMRLNDGRIVVANGGTSELRFFDSEGRFLQSVGRMGDGPGEFRDLQRVWRLPGDSLLAYDFFPGRLSLFDSAGDYVSSVQVVSPEGRQVFVLGPLDDGTLLVQGAPIWSGPGATEGAFQDSVPVDVFSRDGTVVRRLGFFPFAETFRFRSERGWTMTSVPFPRRPVRAAAGSEFIFGPAEEYELQVYDLAGDLRRIIRMERPRRPVTAQDITRFRERRLEAAEREGGGEGAVQLLNRLPVPDFMPPYETVLVDRLRHLWVADYRADDGVPRGWQVFDPDGKYLGEVVFPDGFEPFDIGADYVLGRSTDDFDVEYVQMYSLRRGLSLIE